MNNILKFNDLTKGDGSSTYEGSWPAMQSHNAYAAFFIFLQLVQPARILEIGTGSGGFTQFLALAIKELNIQCPILSYDIIKSAKYDALCEVVDARIENIFNEDYTKINAFVRQYIKQAGTTVVLCDGKAKIKEFNVIAPIIKIGDYIMAHDYAATREIFNKDIQGKMWNWHEISDKDIVEICIKHNLIPYNEKIFERVVWVCKKKI